MLNCSVSNRSLTSDCLSPFSKHSSPFSCIQTTPFAALYRQRPPLFYVLYLRSTIAIPFLPASNITITMSRSLILNKWFSPRISQPNFDNGEFDFEIGCVSCSLVFGDLYNAHLCHDHVWRIDCATESFSNSLTDISLFPVHCCDKGRPVNINVNKHIFPAELAQQYNDKMAEHLADIKIRCWYPECSTFLP
jgi:hypothetical protein